VSASGENLAVIVRAKAQHNERCPAPAHTVLLHPIEIERMGWEEGDDIAGLKVAAEPSIGTGTFELVCDRDQVDGPEGEAVEARGREAVHA
jgi:hypothetical protein